MLIDTQNLVDSESFRREPERYMTAASAGNGPVAVMKDARVIGVLVDPDEYEQMFGVAVRELLSSRMAGPTLTQDEVKAGIQKLIQYRRRGA